MQDRIHNQKRHKWLRRSLRSQATPAEAELWRYLSARKLDGRKFRRQHSVGNYILDFYGPEEKLAVELDGAAYDDPERIGYDADRQHFLMQNGVRVVRFENQMVFEQPGNVLHAIRSCFSSRDPRR